MSSGPRYGTKSTPSTYFIVIMLSHASEAGALGGAGVLCCQRPWRQLRLGHPYGSCPHEAVAVSCAIDAYHESHADRLALSLPIRFYVCVASLLGVIVALYRVFVSCAFCPNLHSLQVGCSGYMQAARIFCSAILPDCHCVCIVNQTCHWNTRGQHHMIDCSLQISL